MGSVHDQMGNFSKEIETARNNQVKMLEAKNKQKKNPFNRIIRGRNPGIWREINRNYSNWSKKRKTSVSMLRERQEVQISIYCRPDTEEPAVCMIGIPCEKKWIGQKKHFKEQQLKALPSSWQTPNHTFENLREHQARWTQKKQTRKHNTYLDMSCQTSENKRQEKILTKAL